MQTTLRLPSLADQAERLIALGIPETTGIDAGELRRLAEAAAPGDVGSLLAVHPDRISAAALAPLLRHRGKAGFIVVDMPDVDDFAPVPQAPLPDAPLYLVADVDRGDHLANRSPDEALPQLTAAGRTPLTLSEGIQWLLHQPAALERNHCFMTIGSRRSRGAGKPDSRTPAIWISNGTGRDGPENRDAPKVGWCWAGNRHTWLGFASAARRSPVAAQ